MQFIFDARLEPIFEKYSLKAFAISFGSLSSFPFLMNVSGSMLSSNDI